MRAILLINTGTPDSPSVKDVWKYLTQFLNDKNVITMPAVARLLLVNAIIIPFRVRKSAGLYRKVWTEGGSPLRIHSERVTKALQKELGEEYEVFMAMRYGKPSIPEVLKEIALTGISSLTIVPMFPQKASSTTGSAVEKAMQIIARWEKKPEIKVVDHFHDHPGFIQSEVALLKKYNPENFDHVLFSFHGLPLQHITDMHREYGHDGNCYNEGNTGSCRKCYAGACHETARLIADALQLERSKYSVAFQSRFSKGWTSPFTDDELIRLAKTGVHRLLVVSPSFVADCLETIVEVGIDYKEFFGNNCGGELTLAESLNSSPEWVNGLASIVRDQGA
jgi:ferrochelatase